MLTWVIYPNFPQKKYNPTSDNGEAKIRREREASQTWRLDVDTCYDEERGLFGTAGIIRASDVIRVLAIGQSISKPFSVVEGELDPCDPVRTEECRGMKLVPHTNCDKFFVSVQAVTNPREDLSYTGIHALEVLKLMDVIKDMSRI